MREHKKGFCNLWIFHKYVKGLKAGESGEPHVEHYVVAAGGVGAHFAATQDLSRKTMGGDEFADEGSRRAEGVGVAAEIVEVDHSAGGLEGLQGSGEKVAGEFRERHEDAIGESAQARPDEGPAVPKQRDHAIANAV